MSVGLINLEDAVIVHRDNGEAKCDSISKGELGSAAGERISGLIDFTDDQSVHADRWERHLGGDEVLYVLDGRLLAIVDHGCWAEETAIGRGQAFVVPRGCWHRLRVVEHGRLMFFTPAAGTELRAHVPGAGAGSIRPDA